MLRILRDWAHLLRPAAVLVLALGLFLLVRNAVIPKSFGQYGHYRPGALDAVRRQPMSFAGQGTCVACHEKSAKEVAGSLHYQQLAEPQFLKVWPKDEPVGMMVSY